jgi:hypothetical protein
MKIEIPPEIQEKLQWSNIKELNEIIITARNTSNNTLLAWAIASKAEYLLSLGSPTDRSQAFLLYKLLAELNSLGDFFIQIGILGKASCWFKGWEKQSADIGTALYLYESLLNMCNLSNILKPWASFGKAECLRLGELRPYDSADLDTAHHLYESILKMPHLSEELKQKSTFGIAECLRLSEHPAGTTRP